MFYSSEDSRQSTRCNSVKVTFRVFCRLFTFQILFLEILFLPKRLRTMALAGPSQTVGDGTVGLTWTVYFDF